MMTPDKAVRLFYTMLGDAMVRRYITKPISWALYRTWEIIDDAESARVVGMDTQEAIRLLDEAERDYYVGTEYLHAIRMAKEALIEKEASDAGNDNRNQ